MKKECEYCKYYKYEDCKHKCKSPTETAGKKGYWPLIDKDQKSCREFLKKG